MPKTHSRRKGRPTIKMHANCYPSFLKIGLAGEVTLALGLVSPARNRVIFGRWAAE